MDPWKQGWQEGRYTRRRVPRVTLPTSKRTQRATFARQIAKAKALGQQMGHRLFLTWETDNPAAGHPANFILTPRETRGREERNASDPLPKRKGKRFALAAITLHQALARFEADVNTAWERTDWRTRKFFQTRRDFLREEIRPLIQTLLFQSWAQLSMKMRDMVLGAFSDHELMDEDWRKACRGSLSAAFVARGFQEIKTTSLSKKAPLKRYEVYQTTSEEDALWKIDLVAVGRIKGLGKVIFCIQVKTGSRPYLEAFLQDPSETRTGETSPERTQLQDALWEGTEDFKAKYDVKERCYPAIIQTGQVPPGVGLTEIGSNARILRHKIQKLLEKVELDLKRSREAERKLREIDEPGIPLRRRRSPKT